MLALTRTGESNREEHSKALNCVMLFLAVTVVLLAGAAGARAADNSILREFAGEWVPKRSLCGKEPMREGDFPLVISKDGLNISVYEESCDVVSVREIGRQNYKVRVSCEAEGQPFFENRSFKFSSDGLVLNGKQKFFRCGQAKKTKTEIPRNVVRGRCHMDICGFYQLGKVTKRIRTRNGELVFSSYKSEAVDVPNVEGPDDQYANVAIPSFAKSSVWQKITHCAKERPFSATRMRNGKWFGELLNLPDGGAAVRSEAMALYFAICHAVFVGADEQWEKRDQLDGFGYSWQWPTDKDQIEFESIEDIVVFAGRRTN